VRAVGDAVTDLARFGNEYIQRSEPWKLVDDDPEEAAQVIHDCVAIAKAIAVLFEPIAPEKTERLWDQLGEDGSVHETTVEAAREGPAGDLAEPTELFEQIERRARRGAQREAGGARRRGGRTATKRTRRAATTARRTTAATKRTTTPLTNPT